MAGLKEIRIRIASVKTTRQVTSAMKIVSAAKLKKAQDAIYQIRPYANKLHGILSSISSSLGESEDSVYTDQREPEKVLIVLISSNRGLCGGFNTNIAKTAAKLVQEQYESQLDLGNIEFLCIGKQGMRQLKYHEFEIADNKNDLRIREKGISNEKLEKITADDVAVYEDPFAYFADVINNRTEMEPFSPYSLENNVLVVKILDAARQSAREGKTVYLK